MLGAARLRSSPWRHPAPALWAPLALLPGLAGCNRSPAPPPYGPSAASPALTFLEPHGPIAAAQRGHITEVVLLLLIVVLPVLVLAPIIAWRYRLTGSARYTPRWSFYWPLELLVWGVPIAIVAVLAVWLWQNTEALDPYAPLASATGPPLEIEVVGYDWKWLFIYPQLGVASMGELAFPVDRPLALELTSDTVMQSFFIPALGSQIYAMPGMATQLHLLASAAGDFHGENTQYNGDEFYQQQFIAKAMSPAAFGKWVKSVETTGIPLSPQAYDAVKRRSTLGETRIALGLGQRPARPIFFKNVPANLFEEVVHSVRTGSPVTAFATPARRDVARAGSRH